MKACRRSIAVASPYVGDYLCKAVAQLETDIYVTLLTRTLITDFASGASDLEAVRVLAERSRGVLSLSSLHAKVYVVNDRSALVTSANATFSGMHRNRECGVQINTRREISKLRHLIESGFGAIPKPQLWDR
jgi:phosphatidylserine/phosphatidylglycerophosphate/cardiolipin synthase-like enzyme